MAEIENPSSNDSSNGGFAGKVRRELREWGVTLAIFIPVYLLFTTFIYELRSIPSESMVPNLEVGDRVAVNKFAYGYSKESVPFGLGRFLPLGEGRLFATQPKRGDVVVFQHPHFPRVMIKRLIGLPGDEIQMRGERLFLNGEPLEVTFDGTRIYREYKTKRRLTARQFVETLPRGKSYTIAHTVSGGQADNTLLFIVPEGHFFFMGDNRDDSLDSRASTGHCLEENGVISRTGCEPRVPLEDASIGFVPFDNLIGRADTVLFTLNFCRDREGHTCSPGRVWKPL